MEEQKRKENRKALLLMIFGVLVLVLLAAGATYAYFQAQAGDGAKAEIDAMTGTTDNLTFVIDDLDVNGDKIIDEDESDDIVINATQANFGKNGNSIGDGITGKAILVANSTTNKAEGYSYYVYLNITKNELKYSSYTKTGEETKVYKTEEAKEAAQGELDEYIAVPELIMTIKKNETPYTDDINGLTKTKLTTTEGTQVDGYDITEITGPILIKNETIEVTQDSHDDDQTNPKTDKWEISIVLLNLNTDQELNTGKTVTGEILIQKEKFVAPAYHKICDENNNSCKVVKNLLADDVKDGKTATLFLHDGDASDSGSDQEAGDYSYRYSGADNIVHNYVCFGSSEEECPEENQYRIIGLFPTEATKASATKTYEIKIIKATPATNSQLGKDETNCDEGLCSDAELFWNSATDNNNWGESDLNTDNLNGYYLDNYIKSIEEQKWYEMISDHQWITAGNTKSNIYEEIAKKTYENEIKHPNIGTALSTAAQTYPAKVGLMYVSDYGYAASPSSTSNWTSTLNNYKSYTSNNWLYMNNIKAEWTITRESDYLYYAFVVYYTGDVSENHVHTTGNFIAVRPVMYLKPEVKITTGSGTSEDPYILSM